MYEKYFFLLVIVSSPLSFSSFFSSLPSRCMLFGQHEFTIDLEISKSLKKNYAILNLISELQKIQCHTKHACCTIRDS
jgi:hypothetical protein